MLSACVCVRVCLQEKAASGQQNGQSQEGSGAEAEGSSQGQLGSVTAGVILSSLQVGVTRASVCVSVDGGLRGGGEGEVGVNVCVPACMCVHNGRQSKVSSASHRCSGLR